MRTIKALGKDVPRDAMLTALHNCTRPLGMGARSAIGRPLTRAEARDCIASREREGLAHFTFDYFLGCPLKVYEIDGAIDGRLYDRDAGDGSFAVAVEEALTMPDVP